MKNTSEYLIEWEQPDGYDSSDVLRQLPSPISAQMREIYNYAVKPEGFHLLDRNVDRAVTGHAMKLFVDEALKHCATVTIKRL